MSNADEKKFKNNRTSSKRCSKQQGPMPRDWCLDASNAWVIQRVRSGRGSFTNQASGCVSGRFETVNVRFAGVGLPGVLLQGSAECSVKIEDEQRMKKRKLSDRIHQINGCSSQHFSHVHVTEESCSRAFYVTSPFLTPVGPMRTHSPETRWKGRSIFLHLRTSSSMKSVRSLLNWEIRRLDVGTCDSRRDE